MATNIDNLELTPSERQECKAMIRKLAYSKWLAAGRPEGQSLAFWLRAEEDWVDWNYVPHRFIEDDQPSPLACECGRFQDRSRLRSIWDVRRLEILTSAYFKWINAGRPENRALEFWLEAENECERRENQLKPKAEKRTSRGGRTGSSVGKQKTRGLEHAVGPAGAV
jgi:hypothetical protein